MPAEVAKISQPIAGVFGLLPSNSSSSSSSTPSARRRHKYRDRLYVFSRL